MAACNFGRSFFNPPSLRPIWLDPVASHWTVTSAASAIATKVGSELASVFAVYRYTGMLGSSPLGSKPACMDAGAERLYVDTRPKHTGLGKLIPLS